MNKGNVAIARLKLELRYANQTWKLTPTLRVSFESLSSQFQFSAQRGDLLLINERWYVTYSGLLSLARRKHCVGITVEPVPQFCDSVNCRFAFKATVYRSRSCLGFVGFG